MLDFDYSGVLNSDYDKCKVLFETIGEVIGRSVRTTLALHSNFYELGGNSLNSIFTVSQLRAKGYSIDISDFISAKNLQEVLSKITDASDSNHDHGMLRAPEDEQIEMTMELLAVEHKTDTIE